MDFDMSYFSQFTGGTITGYTQSATLTVSQAISVPADTKRIEVLLVGGGGGGGNSTAPNSVGMSAGGGFGGAAIIEFPVTGSPLSLVIGAGGAANTDGSPTYIISAGAIYAEVGGGGAGASNNTRAGSGRSGGGGGGGSAQ